MSPERLRLPLLAALVTAFFPLVTDATVMRAVPFDEKVERAASIVVGRVIAQRSEWDDAKKWIVTYSTLRVEKTLKGAPAQEITVVTPGGTVGSIAQEVIGVPRFVEGGEHVVFLRNTELGPTVLHFDQGAYNLLPGTHGERIVSPVAAPGVIMDTQRGRAMEMERARPLKQFEGEIRETVRRREAIRMELIDQQERRDSSLWSHIQRNKLLVALALLGSILAGWQFFRRY